MIICSADEIILDWLVEDGEKFPGLLPVKVSVG